MEVEERVRLMVYRARYDHRVCGEMRRPETTV